MILHFSWRLAPKTKQIVHVVLKEILLTVGLKYFKGNQTINERMMKFLRVFKMRPKRMVVINIGAK